MRKRIKTTIIFASLLILSFVPVRGYALNSVREITYKNVNTVLTKEDIDLRGENYLFSGLTDTLPYTITEDDLGINDLTLYDGETMRTIKIVVTDASREVDRDGWTKIEASEDTRIIYVSSSEGDDDQTHPDEIGNVNPGAHKASDIGVQHPDDSPGMYNNNLRINPFMTSNTEPKGEVRASETDNYGPIQPWKAFDGVSGWGWQTDSNDTGWLQYKFNSKQIVSEYSVTSSDVVDRTPKDWEFKASNDEENWIVLHQANNETGWESNETRIFSFSNAIAFQYYRINVKENNGGSRVRIREFELFGPTKVEVEPVQTISKALSLIRDGYADWLLLKRGDRWETNFEIHPNLYTLSGRSVNEPMLVSAYGNTEAEQPQFDTLRPSGNYWVFSDCNIANFSDTWEFEHVLVEGCIFRGTNSNNNIRRNNTEFRRNVIADNYPDSDSHRQGVFARAEKLLFEENVFDHNGWWNSRTKPGDYEKYKAEEKYEEGDFVHCNDKLYEAGEDNPSGVPGEEESGWIRRGNRTIFNHNLYVGSYSPPVRLRRNVFTRGSAHNVQMGGGGSGLENILGESWIHTLSARGWGGVVPFEYRGNLHLGFTDGGDGGAFNVQALDPEQDHNISDNMFLKTRESIRLFDSEDCGDGIHNLTIENNVFYRVMTGVYTAGDGLGRASNILVKDNIIDVEGDQWRAKVVLDWQRFDDAMTFKDNIYYKHDKDIELPFNIGGPHGGTNYAFSEWVELVNDTGSIYEPVNFMDPHRSLATYNASLGGKESFESFIYTAREQSRHNWDWDYHPVKILEYFREGFTVLANPESIKISGPKELEIPVSGEKNQIYAIEIRDENDTLLKDEPYKANIVGNPPGVSLSGTRLTVTPQAEPGDVIIEVKLDEDKEIRDEITVTLLYDKAAPDKVLPERSFITPTNPELKFGEETKEVLITDIRGNEVFRKEKGTSRFIIWNPGERGMVSIESGIYIYRIKTKDGYEYGTVVVAK